MHVHLPQFVHQNEPIVCSHIEEIT